MSISVKIDVIGLKELEKVLKKLPKELVSKGAGNPIASSLKKAAKPVLEAAKHEAPVDTGRLQRAIKSQRHPKPRFLNEIVGVGVDPGRSRDDESGAWYGYIVHARNPFLKRAFERTRDQALTIFRKSLAQRLMTIARKVGDENSRQIAAKIKHI